MSDAMDKWIAQLSQIVGLELHRLSLFPMLNDIYHIFANGYMFGNYHQLTHLYRSYSTHNMRARNTHTRNETKRNVIVMDK